MREKGNNFVTAPAVVLFLPYKKIRQKLFMKTFLFPIIICICSFNTYAQNWHVNLFGGTSNYLGDLQDKRFTFNQAHLAGGVGLSYDLSSRVSLRGGAMFGKISGDDKKGRNKERNLNFSSGISEGHLGMQYYITPLYEHSLTPYVFAGVALFHFNPYTRDTTGDKYYLKPLSTEGEGFVAGVKNYSLTQFSVPFGGGVKMPLSNDIEVGFELGFRKTFSDYIDDVSNVFVDENLLLTNRGAKAVELAYRGDELKTGSPNYPAAGTKRGSPKIKDWYYFTGLTLSFRLGSGNHSHKKGHAQWDCPKNIL